MLQVPLEGPDPEDHGEMRVPADVVVLLDLVDARDDVLQPHHLGEAVVAAPDVARLEEPMRWGSNYVVRELAAAGFRFTRVVTFDQLALHFFGDFDASREFRFQSMALASVDALELV